MSTEVVNKFLTAPKLPSQQKLHLKRAMAPVGQVTFWSSLTNVWLQGSESQLRHGAAISAACAKLGEIRDPFESVAREGKWLVEESLRYVVWKRDVHDHYVKPLEAALQQFLAKVFAKIDLTSDDPEAFAVVETLCVALGHLSTASSVFAAQQEDILRKRKSREAKFGEMNMLARIQACREKPCAAAAEELQKALPQASLSAEGLVQVKAAAEGWAAEIMEMVNGFDVQSTTCENESRVLDAYLQTSCTMQSEATGQTIVIEHMKALLQGICTFNLCQAGVLESLNRKTCSFMCVTWRVVAWRGVIACGIACVPVLCARNGVGALSMRCV